MKFSVSVIIPAYNVERFIEKAINSALNQEEVGEIIIVNDGSTDKTLQIIEDLKKNNPRINIYHHPQKRNKGRSASRNLGITKAKEPFVAFLDADDFYLANRFKNDKELFQEHKNIDGVYNAVGFHFYRKVSVKETQQLTLNTISKKIPPEALFYAVITSKYGYLHLNGITVKKEMFNTIGLFNISLMVAEDSDIILKMALKCRLESGIIQTPLALRGIHNENIFTRGDLYKKYHLKFYESAISWSWKNIIPVKKIDVIYNYLWIERYKQNNSLFNDTLYWVRLVIMHPNFIFSYLGIKYFPMVRLRQKLFPFFYQL